MRRRGTIAGRRGVARRVRLRRRPSLLVAALVWAGSFGGAGAEAGSRAGGPTSWVQSSYDDFRAGDIASVALGENGEIRLAPELVQLADLGEAFVWSIDEAADGTVFAAAGTDGGVYRLDAAAAGDAPQPFFRVEGTVHALTVGPDGYLYVAASPGGGVWRVPTDGTAGEAGDPWYASGARYVWAMTFGADGALYLGTGDGGVIHRVEPDGQGRVFYDSAETHITALAIDGQGNVLAGSSDRGHVYRLSPDGDVFVVLDSRVKQVTGIVPTDEGVYVAGMETSAAAEPSAAGGAAASASNGNGAQALKGAVFLLHPDGFAEQLWGSATEEAHSLEAAAPGVIVGTGPEGRVLRIRPGPDVVIVQDADPSQITALRGRGRALLVGTSNLGYVYRLRETFGSSGEYLSQVKDTETTSRWGRLRWRGATPNGTTIRFFTRAGNTEDPDETWSDWDGPYTDPEGSPVDSPAARFIQWKAELGTADTAVTPVLEWVELVYVQRNLRPRIGGFVVHPAGVVYRQTASFEDTLPIGSVPSSVQQALARQQGRDGPASSSSASFLGQPFFVPGSQTFSWEAADANGDRMRYTLSYRGADESSWKPLASDLAESLYVWDTRSVPDGLYRARLGASDAPSHPAGEELEGSRTSEPFLVDNTAPTVSALTASDEGGSIRVAGAAADQTSLIREIEYAVDGGDWHAVLPADGLPDSMNEQIEFSIGRLAAGEHTIVVRVTDNALNTGTGRVIVTSR